jgi:hypothetical protein
MTEKQMEARWDAETLSNAEQIKSNPKRLAAAQKAAKVLVAEEEAKAKGMAIVASGTSMDD